MRQLAVTDAHTAVTPRPDSRIRLHDLAIRPDRDEWIVGRFETRQFVALPRAGVTALELLRAGHTIEQAVERLACAEGREFDVLSFVEALMELEFVAEVDGRPVPCTPPRPASFPRIRPEHVRFALSPVFPVLFAILMVAAVATLVERPDLLPSFHNLLWSPGGSIVLALSVTAGWSLVFVHELAHFVVARATGVHARIGLGTRLQFLVAETDISGIELAPRRHRLTAYLAGMSTNFSVAAAAVLFAAVTAQAATPHRILAAVVVIALLPLPFQFMVFMRTDIYFVLQDLTACRDLYGDGIAYARYLGNRLRPIIFRRSDAPEDPSLCLPSHERRAVRVYSIVLVLGTVLCLTAMVTVTLPADLTLIYRAIDRLGPSQPVATNLDSVVVLLILGTLHAVWGLTWWRRHRAKRQ
ncbi:site-2 protease family protein [Nocardia pseudovaccinii]|uniref:site-2 protease family protein n=1 Tax=Nocardia pseudovaccinii TaxID=189540 RepID=UPI003D8B509E